MNHIAQTSGQPKIIEVSHARGVEIFDISGKSFIDMASGIGPSLLGHSNPKVVNAIHTQAEKHLHTMVYGEHVQIPQTDLAWGLIKALPEKLNSVYFLSSGSEAIEAAMKIARLHTRRTEIISAKKAYHGSTLGAESLRSDIDFTMHMAPGIPGIRHISFNKKEDLRSITEKTAAVIMETIQAEAGVIVPDTEYMVALRKVCSEKGVLLILDEIQMGLGRTGKLWAFEHFNIVPDILVLGKALGGGLPLSACVAERKILSNFSSNPALSHLTTFGGNPLSCAAGLAVFNELRDSDYISKAEEKGLWLYDGLQHERIKRKRRIGLMVAIEFENGDLAFQAANRMLEEGVIADLLLFNHNCVRFAPPLIITKNEMNDAVGRILSALDKIP